MHALFVAALVTLAAPAPADSAAVPRPAADRSAVSGAADSGAAGADSARRALVATIRDDGVLVPSGTARGQVTEPAGLAYDAFGRLYVTDASLHRLQRFEKDGQPSAEAGALGSDPNQMRRPGSVALLGSLGVAVLDIENRRVLTYDLFGRLIGTLVDLQGAALQPQLGRVDPVAMGADAGGAVYIADRDADRILAFDFGGRYLRTLGGFGARAGSFRGIAGLAVSPGGGIAAADRGNARVQRLDANGRVLAAWPLPAGKGGGVLAMAVDDTGRVAVADEASGRLWVFGPGGALLASTTGLGRPRAVAFAPDGALVVAETAPGRVRRMVVGPPTSAPASER